MANTDNLHKISISGPILNYEVDVDGPIAAQIYQGLSKLINDDGLTNNIAEKKAFDSTSILNTSPSLPDMSAREYILDIRPKTNPQKLITLIKYHADRGQKLMSIDELKKMFQEVSEPVPTHFAREIAVTRKKAWIAVSSDGGYYLTNTGEQEIESRFKSTKQSTVKRSFLHRKVGSTTFTPVSIDQKVQDLQIDIYLDNFPSFMDMHTLGDKVLWILVKSKSLGIPRLNQKEVEYLSIKLGDHVPRKSISAVLGTHIKNKRLYAPVDEKHVTNLQILNLGEDYIKSLH